MNGECKACGIYCNNDCNNLDNASKVKSIHRKKCKACGGEGELVSAGHYHEMCPACHGTRVEPEASPTARQDYERPCCWVTSHGCTLSKDCPIATLRSRLSALAAVGEEMAKELGNLILAFGDGDCPKASAVLAKWKAVRDGSAH